MKNKLISIILCFLLLTITFTTSAQTKIVKPLENENTTLNGLLNGSWVEEIDGVKILHVQGSYYQMGYQHGYLLKEQCLQNLRAVLDFSTTGFYGINIEYQRLLEIWDQMEDYIPQRYIDEMQGLADGAGIDFENVSAAYTFFVWIDLMMIKACTGIAAWGPATKDGSLYHIRSCDLPPLIKDPETGKYAHENWVLIIRKPEEGYASVSPSVVGISNMGGGINEKGIAIGLQACTSYDYKFKGLPAWFKCAMVMDQAANITEAEDIILSNLTLGWNYILSDGKIPTARVIETTGNYSYVGTYDNETESNYPFTEIDHVIRRTNFFIDPLCASTQRDKYNIGGIMGFIRFILGKNMFFTIWRMYRSSTRQIKKNWGEIDLDTSMNMTRTIYNMKTDLFMYLYSNILKGFSIPWNQWAYNHETGDIAVSFADKHNSSCENPVHNFKFDELMNLEP